MSVRTAMIRLKGSARWSIESPQKGVRLGAQLDGGRVVAGGKDGPRVICEWVWSSASLVRYLDRGRCSELTHV